MAIPAVTRIRTIFFLHALASGGLYPRIPDIQEALGIDEATLGIDFLGFTLGAIAVFFFASSIIERLGTRPVLLVMLPVLAAGTALLAMMPDAVTLFALFFAYGAVYGLANIAMNVEADRIESVAGRRIMTSCHGLWSLGYLLSTLIGTLAAGLSLSPAVHLWLVAVPVILAAVLVILPLVPAAPRPHTGTGLKRFALPTVPVMLLVAFVVGPALLEGALRNWSVIYMRDNFAAPDWVDTLTLPLFLAAQSAGRMVGDRLVERWGPVPLTRALMMLTVLSVVAVVLAPTFWVALVAFLVMGLGLCVYFPITTSAAAHLGDRPASQNVASLGLATQVILMAAPAALGFVAAYWGTRMTFAVVLPLVIAAVWLVRYLQPRRAAAVAPA